MYHLIRNTLPNIRTFPRKIFTLLRIVKKRLTLIMLHSILIDLDFKNDQKNQTKIER